MTTSSDQSRHVWALARRQHYVITHPQLVAMDFTVEAIKHRLATGRLHRIHRGVYAVGRRDLSRKGEWMAAVLACGPGALLSHLSAAALFEIVRDRPGPIHVCVPGRRVRRRGIVVHSGARSGGWCDGIPLTSPAETLIDLAACLGDNAWEAAVNEADSLDLCTPDDVRAAVETCARPGAGTARTILDRHTFVLTDSELERLFLRIVRSAGLSRPLTRQYVEGWRVDFYWPDIGLVVEADGLRYHRTAARQTRDALRDQAHVLAELTRLRFTHWQIRHEPDYVRATLTTVAARLAAA